MAYVFDIRLIARLTLAFCGALAAGIATADHHESGAVEDSPTVLITGANRGLGLEFARQYAASGWSVIGTARRPAQASDLNALDVDVMPLDVTDKDSISALAAALGERKVDLLINNAGIFPMARTLESVDAYDYAQTLMVNTLGPVLVTQALLPNLRQGDLKRIVNITSQLGSIERSNGGFYGYRESKAALNMFTRTLAGELGPEGFVCLVVHPGWARTDMGGPSATQSAEEAVTGMRSVIDNLTADDNGGFIGFDGESVAW
ncbi:MAG: SDR family oxidoreductase [Pseudomonadota bacterium]